MREYNFKRLSDIEPIDGFNLAESAILRENNINSKEEVNQLIPDKFGKVIKIKEIKNYLWENCNITGKEEFKKILDRFKDKKICILGDYDCDGIMGTTIFRIVLEYLGFNCMHVIPDRLLDGFAVKQQHIDTAITEGAELIVTVDNGTSAIEPVRYAKEKGLSVIITDHHMPESGLPEADLIINPHLSNERFKDICGAVVAMKLAAYLLKEENVDDNRLYETIFDLGAIATVGDMMPLIDENRYIVKLGLESINRIKDRVIYNRVGKIISGMADINYMSVYNSDRVITEETLAYYICPVLNATGRIEGNVNPVVEDIIKCAEDGVYLTGYKEKNKERKRRTKEISKKHIPTSDSVDITVLNESDFNYPINGLIGLLANRISNTEHKPCFVGYIPKDNSICKFSGRTVNGYSIFDAFQSIKEKYPELKIEGGGHEGAVGIEMPVASIEKFKELICEDYNNYHGSEEIPTVYILEDNEIEEVTDAHFKMAPFGEKFQKLKFMVSGILKEKSEAVNMIVVNGMEFKVYTELSKLPNVGTKVNVYFSISFGNRMFSEFKLEEIEEVNA